MKICILQSFDSSYTYHLTCHCIYTHSVLFCKVEKLLIYCTCRRGSRYPRRPCFQSQHRPTVPFHTLRRDVEDRPNYTCRVHCPAHGLTWNVTWSVRQPHLQRVCVAFIKPILWNRCGARISWIASQGPRAPTIENHQRASSLCPPLINLRWPDPRPPPELRRWLYGSPPLPSNGPSN